MDDDVCHLYAEAMTVAELREQLEGLEADAKVLIASNYGDRCQTEQVLAIEEILTIDTGSLSATAYSRSGVRVVADREPGDEPLEDDDEDVLPVVIIRT